MQLSGDDARSFSLTDNKLFSDEIFDFETKKTYAISLSVLSNLNEEVSKDFIILVEDVNEAPIDIILSPQRIGESLQINSLVGDISVVDEDLDDTHRFSLSGDDASSFLVEENRLLSAEIFDYEFKSTYDVTITALDNGMLSFTQPFTISINDIISEPPYDSFIR